jgi:3-hydroxyacyl-CoA dehydrogenase
LTGDHIYEDIGRSLGTDYFGIGDQLTGEERDYLRRTREFVDTEVLPVINGLWERAEFPWPLIKRMAASALSATASRATAAPMSPISTGLVHMELNRGDGSLAPGGEHPVLVQRILDDHRDGDVSLLFARQLQVPVVMTDFDQARLDKGVGYVHGEIDKLLARKRLGNDRANRVKALVTGSLTKDAFADAEFVIEAVFEEMSVKQRVFAEVEAAVSAECVLATNTSSLSVTEMAAGLAHPERVVGFDFFNPVAVLPLLEIVRAKRTDDASLATAFAVARELNKTAVLVKDAPGFVVNRLLARFLGEVNKSIDEGTPFEVADSALEPVGLPMSPLVLLQLVGPAIAQHTTETMYGVFPHRFHISENLGRVVAAGKTAFYITEGGQPKVDPEVAALYKVGDSPSTAEQLRERTLAALAEEARLMLDEGVVAEPQDIDLCMITGVGWPFHTVGITPYLDRTGISEKVTGRRCLAPGVASVPTP